MRSTFNVLILFILFSCGKEQVKEGLVVEESFAVAPYDTIAIDSFSQGAVSVDVARRIKVSSIKFQDSLKQIKLKNEEEQLLKKAKEEQLIADKKAEELKTKAAAEKKKAAEKVEVPAP